MIPYVSKNQNQDDVNKNLLNKGFFGIPPSTGCTYVELPTSKYQAAFENLQKEMISACLPVSYVDLAHTTVIAAKIVDKRSTENWTQLEAVQRIYQQFYSYHVKNEMDNGLGYREATKAALRSAQKTMTAISSKKTVSDAWNAIEDPKLRDLLSNSTSTEYDEIKVKALELIKATSFSTSISRVELSSNGSITFQSTPDDRLLDLRLDLIIAGEGISKWPDLSVRNYGWSTVGYTEECVSSEMKSNIDNVIQHWVETHQKELSAARVKFDAKHFASIAFRANDFSEVKQMQSPLKNNSAVSLEDLKLKQGEITPIFPRRNNKS